jgi:hypothetical protein
MADTEQKPAWMTPSAIALPEEGYFELQQGRYGPIFPQTPANFGFSILAKVKPGREQIVRDYGKTIEAAVAVDPTVLEPLKLHFLRWLIFPIGDDRYFMYQGIFDTDFDKYIEDAVTIFGASGITTVFVNLEGFPEEDWNNVPTFQKFFREHQCPSFMEYAEYPRVTAVEIRKALQLKAAFGDMLDQMQ